MPDMTGRLASAADALTFVTSGNAYFTLRSTPTSTRYTYQVAAPRGVRGGRILFVRVLFGPDNSNDYRYLGVIEGGRYRRTRSSTLPESDARQVAFGWMHSHLMRGQLPPQAEIWHEGRCGRCGRRLTVPESVARGLGPECAEMVQS